MSISKAQVCLSLLIGTSLGLLTACGGSGGDADAENARSGAAAGKDAGRPRRQCPPQLSAAARREAGPADDIIGLRPGMPWEDVVAVLECREGMKTFQTAEIWSVRQNYGIPTRQLLRATDGSPCTDADLRSTSAPTSLACDTAGGRFDPVRDISEEVVVLFTGMPGEEIARAVWRRTVFPEDAFPSTESLVASLVEKYGSPTYQSDEMNMMNQSPRPRATNLFWPYDRQGRLMRMSDAVRFNRDCANGMKAWFGARHTWNSGCGLTVRAELLPLEGSRLVTRSMDVVVVDQAGLFAASDAFEAALADAYQAGAGQQGARPEL